MPARRRPSACRCRSRSMQVDAAPDLWRELMDESLRATDPARRCTRRSRPGRSACCSASRAVTRSAAGPRTAGCATRCRATSSPPSWPSPTCAPRSSPRTTSRPTPPCCSTGLVAAHAGVARPHLLARRPARLRAHRPTAPSRRMAAAAGVDPIAHALRRDARARRAAPADAAVLQLRRRATTTPSARCCCTRRACRACPTAARTAA